MKQLLLLVAFGLSLLGCTKDRVPNPDSLNPPANMIASENFDEDSVSLPGGWTASPSSGWKISTTNSSIGYTGASGKYNIDISNATGVNGDFSITSKSISTVGYKNIAAFYAARMTTKFTDSLSAISSFSYSIDNGSTWVKVPYIENSNNSNWSWINGGLRIALPVDAANQTGIKFQWMAHLKSNASGTYRIDDFQVFGTPSY